MSTQSPHPPTPKGPRNGNPNHHNNNNTNRRSSKKNTNPNTNTTPHAQKVAMLNTPPSSPPRNISPGVATDSSANMHSKKKQPPRSVKKMPNGNRASPAPNGGNGHQRQASQASNTPAKDAAYAGPTFHASPAPSALPMPSFFSKSYPESELPTTLETDSEENEPVSETTPSKPRAARPQPQQQSQPQTQSQPAAQHKPSPIDFLFEAAKRARNPDSNSLTSPEAAAARLRSPQTDSKALHGNSNNGGGIFAFEMGSPERSQIGPSFAPSYQDRMNALRASSSPSHTQSQPSLNTMEDQRRLKTEELKHLLLNPRPQKPPSSVSPPHERQSPGPRPHTTANVPHYATPMRTTSGPPSTMSHGPSQPPPMPGNYSYGHHLNGSQPNIRNTNSPLRRELPHNSAGSSPAPYGHHYNAPAPQRANYVSPQPQYTNAAFPMPTHSPSPTKSLETKQMEDDLRRVLKIGGPGIPSGGMQSPFAA
ncbi:hypothetical protein N7509_001221 [Penicillium cosmopolitanum]|uniref:Uncharacterized protein n=1 Tax=Penicillium cosmopolitanum TaxID=1131564 RepID=A0A9W9WBQ9_9EURO|nr:uncharacterized protein N7509_001221 [Penicillium cosmopolitanum]KAJ5414594.1 hypothetical protein N7509_001221 [Penicillium cosmopolitanum]